MTPGAGRHVVTVGDAIEVGDFTVYIRPVNDPNTIEPVSYVVEYGVGTFYHGGDSRPAPEFIDVRREFIDVGILAPDTVGSIHNPKRDAGIQTEWYTNENGIFEAARSLRLGRLLLSPWGMRKGVTADPKMLHEHAASFDYPRIVERVTVGDRIRFGEPGIVPLAALR